VLEARCISWAPHTSTHCAPLRLNLGDLGIIPYHAHHTIPPYIGHHTTLPLPLPAPHPPTGVLEAVRISYVTH